MYKAITISAVILLTGCETLNLDSITNILAKTDTLNQNTIVQGLKQALQKGSKEAVNKLSKDGAYQNNSLLKIELPEELNKVTTTLRTFGFGKQVDALEAQMNEAAEHAATYAAPVFIKAITKMSIEDATNILNGSDTAATDYFKEKTTAELTSLYKPIVKAQMEKIGLVKDFNTLLDTYNKIPLVPKTQFSVDNYVTENALKGLFSVVAQTEKDIRNNPAARTTELLKLVFGN